MATLYFCVDGVLRIKSKNNKYMFAVDFIQKNEQLSDFSFWAQWWHQPVVFEKNLTFSQFFQCLSPWLQFWGEYTNIDLLAYYEELKKPSLVQNSKDDLDWLNLAYYTEIRPTINYEDNHSHPETASIHTENKWHVYSYYELTGYILGREETVLVEWMPINQLANIPITIDGQQSVMIDEFLINKYGTEKDHLTNPEGLGVVKIHNEMDHETQFSYIQGPKTHTMREVVAGMFYRFDKSPEVRDQLDAQFEEDYEDSLDDDLEDMPIAVSTEQSLQDEMIEVNEIYEEQNAILAQKFEDDDPYFNNLLNKAKKDIDGKIRIGNLQEAKPLEARMLKYIQK